MFKDIQWLSIILISWILCFHSLNGKAGGMENQTFLMQKKDMNLKLFYKNHDSSDVQ